MSIRRRFGVWIGSIGLACSLGIGFTGNAADGSNRNGASIAPPTGQPSPSGWPSAYPINIYAQHLSVTQHVLTKDGDGTPIDHLWLDAQSSQVSAGLKGYFTDTAFMYGAPFELNTKYRVKIVGTHTGGAFNVEWTFTTGSKRPFGT